MKTSLFILLAFISSSLFAQTIPDYSVIKLEDAADYKASEKFVLQASAYLLTTPIEKNNIGRLNSMQFLIKWMTGTPDYQFTLDGAGAKLFKNETDLLGVYMAAMVKYVLENRSLATDQKAVKLSAFKLLIDYYENPGYNVRQTKELKKLSEARQKNELEKYLGII